MGFELRVVVQIHGGLPEGESAKRGLLRKTTLRQHHNSSGIRPLMERLGFSDTVIFVVGFVY
jgi:hypothetical protein